MKFKRHILFQMLCLISLLFQLCACDSTYSDSTVQQTGINNPLKDAGLWDYLDTYIVNPEATILTIQCWAPDQYLETCVQNYNLTHDDVQIKIEAAFENYADTKSAFAALDRLNAKLIAGDTPDIFSFNSLNVMALENADLVLDLRDYMETDDDFQSDDYYMDIWERFALHGNIYEFIPCFELIGLTGHKSEIGQRTSWTVDEWINFSENHPDKNMLNITPMVMLEYMEMYTLSNFVDVENATCNFETEPFYRLLELVSKMPTQRNDDANILEIARINSIYDYLFMPDRTQQVFTGFPSPNGDGPSIQAIYSYGICSKTKYPDECWDFLMYLLDEQNADNLSSFSMRKSVNERLFEQAQLPADNPDSLVYESLDANENQIPPLSNEEVDYLRNLLNSVETIRFRYSDVEKILSEEVPAYLSGDKTVEEVAALIQNRASIFLAEQE